MMTRQDYKIHFAPMQGYTDFIFRNAFQRYFGGVEIYYTPFIRIEKGVIRNRDLKDIQSGLNEVPCLVPQILPGTPEEFHLLVKEIQKRGYRQIDINLGCPFPLIAGKRKGAGMLPYPQQVKETVNVMEEYPELQFSLKMRLGWENASECMFLLDILNNLRFCHITVHARTGKQQYKGVTNQEAFEDFYKACKHPLFYNGDLLSGADIDRIIEKYPLLMGVSVGRGLLSSPLMAKEFYENETFSEKERMDLYFAFHKELFESYSEKLQGEKQLLMKMKTLWEYFLPETDRKLLKCIKKANKLSQYTEAVRKILTV